LIKDSGKRKKDVKGAKAIVWILAEEGTKEKETEMVSQGNLQVTGMEREDLSRTLDLCKLLSLFKSKDTVSLSLNATSDGLIISGESGGCIIRSLLPGKTEAKGSTLIDLETLLNLSLVGKTASIKVAKGKIEIRSGHANYKISKVVGTPTLPSIPKPNKETVNIQAGVFTSALKAIWFSQDDSGTKDLRILWGKGKLRMETSDEFRGVTYLKPMPVWKEFPLKKAVLSKKTLDAMTKCFMSEDIVNLDLSSSKLRFYTSDRYLEVPVITTSDLPQVGSVLQAKLEQLKKSTVSCSLDGKELKVLTKAAMTVLRDAKKYASAHFLVEVKDEFLKIQTEGDIGSFTSRIPITEKKGEMGTARVLCRSIKDIASLAAASGEEIQAEIWRKDLLVLKSKDRDFQTMYAIVQVEA
jgi:DNA polymerase III sliding clamp (beta) subunit (PCNA family)